MALKHIPKVIDLDTLRNEIEEHKEKGKKIISHFKKMEEYYEEWEEELVKIQEKILEASNQLGISKEEVEEYDALADALK